MRVANWKGKELLGEIKQKVIDCADSIMTGVVVASRADLMNKIETWPRVVRKGKFAQAHVQFTPKTGPKAGRRLVSFDTDKRWTGRWDAQYDSLYRSIRKVDKPGSGNKRVYAGNLQAYWASMVEKTGYTDRGGKHHAPLHFLQEPFLKITNDIEEKIKQKFIEKGGI